MIRDKLIPALKREFPGWEIAFGNPPEPVAIFPAAQEAVGKLMIYDDGNEATVLIEKITHSHFNPYDPSLDADQIAEAVTADVIDFLNNLFSDRILLSIHENQRSAGWTNLDVHDGPTQLDAHHRYYLWSRPYPNS